MKLVKIVFFIGLIIVLSVFIYLTPYFFFNNLLKDAKNGSPLMRYVDERVVEYNIFNRYQNILFSDIDVDSLMQDQIQKKKTIEQKIIYGVDILIEEDNISHLFKTLREDNESANKNIKIDLYYTNFNTFNIDFEIDNKKQTIELKRKNLILWKMTDLIFEVDLNSLL